MIAQLTGKLTTATPEGLVVDVQGVGYELMVSKKTFERLPPAGESVTLLVHTHLTEGSLALYGFMDPGEKTLFRKLISVTGIGPRSALQIMSGLSCGELVSAILSENLVELTAINGIGKKTAERLIVELKDKIFTLLEKNPAGPKSGGKTYEEVLSALMNLGYNRLFAERALKKIRIAPEASIQEVLKQSLSLMAS